MRKWTEILAILLALTLASSIENPDLAFVKSVSQNENTTQAIDKLAKTARILSAVTLLSGLSDGSIPVDNAISELMNLGSIDLKSLENFDKTKVDAFIDKLKSTNMVGDVKYERGIIDMKTIKESWINWSKSPEVPDKAAYGELAKLKSLDVEGLKSKIPTVENSNKKLKQFSSLSDQDVASLKSSLKSVTDALNSVKGNTDLKKTADLLKRWKKLSSMVHVFQLYNDLPSLEYMTDDAKKDFISNIDALKNLETVKIGSIFEAINSVISSRFIFHPTDRQQTSGFVNGFQDFQKLENDVKDEWVTNLFAAFPNFDKVTTLISIKEPMEKLDSKWKSSATQSIYTSMKLVDSLRSFLVVLPKIPSENELLSGLSTLEKCYVSDFDVLNTRTLVSSMKSLGTLSSKIIAFNDIEALSQQNKVAGIIGQLSKNTNPDDVQKLEEFFANLEPKLKILTGGTSIKDEVENIETGSFHVTDFHNDKFMVAYVKNFECFAQTDFEKLLTLVRITTHVRNIKSTKVSDDVTAAAAAVAGTTENLKQLRESVANLVQTEESKSLKEMDGLKKVSKPFGEAVNSLVSTMVAMEKGKEIDTMFLKGILVESAVGASRRPDVETTFRKDWGNFAETVSQVSELFGAIREWQNGLSIPKDVRFESMDTLFSNLAGLPDLDLQTDQRLAAVESDNVNVIQNIKTLREDFIKELLKVAKLDLQFSRFKSAVAGMPETMKQVSKILNPVKENSVVFGPPVKPDKPVDTERILFTIIIVMLVSCFFSTLLSLCIGNRCGMRTKFKNCLKRIFKKPTRSERNMMK